MPAAEKKIRKMIRRQLRRANPPDTKLLYARAARLDSAVKDLDLRQFHARHVLPVHRALKREKGPTEDEARKIMAFVKGKLLNASDVATSTLYEEAQRVASSVRHLTLRQFHARFPLQVKRRLAEDRAAGRRVRNEHVPAVQDTARRRAVREQLIAFAKRVADAETSVEMISLLEDIDRIVSEVVEAATTRDADG